MVTLYGSGRSTGKVIGETRASGRNASSRKQGSYSQPRRGAAVTEQIGSPPLSLATVK
jgi:hypothetical protein